LAAVSDIYIAEDIPVGCHIFRELAQKFDILVPVIESMIHLASVMTDAISGKQGSFWKIWV
jgi:opine dehydrogenase